MAGKNIYLYINCNFYEKAWPRHYHSQVAGRLFLTKILLGELVDWK